MYPENENSPEGKLRLVYECNPMAFIAYQAGGLATDGQAEPTGNNSFIDLHQRSPFYIGSKNMVRKIEEFLELYH